MKRLNRSIVTISAFILAGYSYFTTPAEATIKRNIRDYSNPAKIEYALNPDSNDFHIASSDDLKGIEKLVDKYSDEKPYSLLDRLNLEFVFGGYHAPIGFGPGHEDWEYVEAGIRLVMDITDNIEGMLELSYAKTTKGWDDHVTGFLLWFRYNFDTDWKLKPYFQCGAGIVNNDIYKNTNQSVIGQNKEYYLKAGFGLFYDITETSRVGGELMFGHISNNGEAEYNDGANALGINILYSINLDFLKK